MKFPIIKKLKWIRANIVHLTLKDGRIFECEFPVISAKKARIVDKGVGVDPGDGKEGDALWAIRGAKLIGFLDKIHRKAASPRR